MIQYLIDGLATGSLYVLLALGFTLVFGVMGMMNVAHADLYMLAVFSFLWLGTDAGLGTVPGVVLGVGAAVLAGWLIYVVVLSRVDKAVPLALFVGTLGVSYVIENLVAKLVEFRARSVPPLFTTTTWEVAGLRVTNSDLLVLAATVAMGLGLLAWLKLSSTGQLLRAESENTQLAEVVGIDTGRMMALSVVIASAIAGIGGLLVANKTQGINPFVANDVSLKMFAVAVVAGAGSVGGAMLVGFALGIIESLAVAYVGSTWQNVIGLLAMVTVLLFRPQGLFGRYHRVG